MNNTLTTIIGCSITFLTTTLGSFIILFIKGDISKRISCLINGFSSGIMIAASVWGLLIPSFSYAQYLNNLYFLPSITASFLGCLFLFFIDVATKKLSKTNNLNNHNIKKFVTAFTIHNIPEGMAIGFAFGNALKIGSSTALASAMGISIAIAVQNIPEGFAVALPVYKETNSKSKGILLGSATGIVEPIFALLGIVLANTIGILLPWLLAFSAGTMLFVAVDDLIPCSKANENSKIGAWAFMFGFILMMTLDVLLAT